MKVPADHFAPFTTTDGEAGVTSKLLLSTVQVTRLGAFAAGGWGAVVWAAAIPARSAAPTSAAVAWCFISVLSVAGAVGTPTHGSGVSKPKLATPGSGLVLKDGTG